MASKTQRHPGPWPEISARQFRDLANYVRDIADLLDLRDWKLNIEPVPEPDPAFRASCSPVEGRRFARVAFSRDVATWPPDLIRSTVAHELIHCHFSHLDDVVGKAEKPLGLAFGPWHDAYKLAAEHAIDALAEAFADHCPMPPRSLGKPSIDHAH
jgi:hypothetical protein